MSVPGHSAKVTHMTEAVRYAPQSQALVVNRDSLCMCGTMGLDSWQYPTQSCAAPLLSHRLHKMTPGGSRGDPFELPQVATVASMSSGPRKRTYMNSRFWPEVVGNRG